jgi:hypothetical protein
MQQFIDHLESDFDNYQVEFRVHAARRMFQRSIRNEDVEYVLKHGYIIEGYMDDFPFPSFLINGKSADDRPIHLVVGDNSDENILVIITAYEPDETKWKENFSKRVL